MPYYKAKFSTKAYYKSNILSDYSLGEILLMNNSQSKVISVLNLLGAATINEEHVSSREKGHGV